MQSTGSSFNKLLEKIDHAEQLSMATVKDLNLLRTLLVKFNTDSVLWIII